MTDRQEKKPEFKTRIKLQDFRLLQQCSSGLRSSGMLCSTGWYFFFYHQPTPCNISDEQRPQKLSSLTKHKHQIFVQKVPTIFSVILNSIYDTRMRALIPIVSVSDMYNT